MTQPRTRWRAALAATSIAALGAALLTGTTAASADTEAASTPVPIVTPDGVVFSYLLNTKVANPGQTNVVSKAVQKAGGVVVQAWPQIGVVVAHSDRASFRTDVAKSAGNALDSVGATRSVPVSEGTPADVSTTWGKGASGYKKGSKKPVNGDVPSVEAPAAAADPREAEQWDMQMIKADQAHKITDGSRNVLVGVLDSGIDADHPDLVANLDVANSVSCVDAGRPSTTGWEADDERPRHPRGRHHRRRPQRRRHRGRRAERAPGLGQGRQRRRVHLPRVRRLRVRRGGREAHGRHEQQLLRRPVRVLLRRPARPARRQGGRAPRGELVDRAGRRPRRCGRQLGHGPVGQDVAEGHRQPRRRHSRHPGAEQHLRRHPDRARRRGHRLVGAALPDGHARAAGCPASRTAASVSSTSRPRGPRSSPPSSRTTATAPRAAPRWPRRTWRASSR